MKKKNYRVEKIAKKGPATMLNVMANDPTEAMFGKLRMFYQGCFENSVAYMEGMDSVTGELVEVLVGYETIPGSDGLVDVYPLARLLTMEEGNKIILPTGDGGYQNAQPGQKQESSK